VTDGTTEAAQPEGACNLAGTQAHGSGVRTVRLHCDVEQPFHVDIEATPRRAIAAEEEKPPLHPLKELASQRQKEGFDGTQCLCNTNMHPYALPYSSDRRRGHEKTESVVTKTDRWLRRQTR